MCSSGLLQTPAPDGDKVLDILTQKPISHRCRTYQSTTTPFRMFVSYRLIALMQISLRKWSILRRRCLDELQRFRTGLLVPHYGAAMQ